MPTNFDDWIRSLTSSDETTHQAMIEKDLQRLSLFAVEWPPRFREEIVACWKRGEKQLSHEIWSRLNSEINDVLEWIGKAGQLNEELRSRYETVKHQIVQKAAEAVFDFGTGPVSFLPPGETQPKDTIHPMASSRVSAQNDVAIQKRIFLKPWAHAGSDRPPAMEYAEEFVRGQTEGVHAVAGVRGGGKSTFLNLIQWTSMQRLDNEPRPLVVRADLGTSFKDEKFTLDLMGHICQEARQLCRQRPYAVCDWPQWLNRVRPFAFWWTRTLSEIARWCRTNLAWAMIAAIITVVFISIDVSRPVKSSTLDDADAASQPKAKGDSPVDPSWKTTPALCGMAALCFILVVGMAYCLADQTPMKRLARRSVESIGRRLVERNIVRLACFGIGAMVGYIAASLGAGWAAQSPSGAGLSIAAVNTLAVCAGVTAAIAAWVALLTPYWWWTYAYCAGLSDSIRRRDADRSIVGQLPYLKEFSGLFGALLPQRSDHADVAEMDQPFAQQQLKELLRHCVGTFGRVVVLIDDVDVLPSAQYHAVLRLLRPFSKVRGVCCVVCVPRYFFEAMHVAILGDLHSTLSRIWLIGDPQLYVQDSDETSNPMLGLKMRTQPTNSQWRAYLRDLFDSQLRIFVNDPGGARYPDNPPFLLMDAILDLWVPHGTDTNQTIPDKVWEIVRDLAGSRRELIRETTELLQNSARTPFMSRSARKHIKKRKRNGFAPAGIPAPATPDEKQEAIVRREFKRQKLEHHMREILLDCDPAAHKALLEDLRQLYGED